MLGAWLKKTGMQNRELYPDAIQKWNLNPVPHTHPTKCRFEMLKVCPKNSQTILGSSKTWTCQQWTHHEFHSNFLVSVGSNTNGLSTEQETATAFQTKMLLNHLKKPPSKGHENLMSVFGMGRVQTPVQEPIVWPANCLSPPWSHEDLIMERCPRTSRAGPKTWVITHWRM